MTLIPGRAGTRAWKAPAASSETDWPLTMTALPWAAVPATSTIPSRVVGMKLPAAGCAMVTCAFWWKVICRRASRMACASASCCDCPAHLCPIRAGPESGVCPIRVAFRGLGRGQVE